MSDYSAMTISELAKVISNDWSKVYFGAIPYLNAMRSLSNISDDYFLDSGKEVVLYFLSNANTWKGPVAREVKQELKKRLR